MNCAPSRERNPLPLEEDDQSDQFATEWKFDDHKCKLDAFMFTEAVSFHLVSLCNNWTTCHFRLLPFKFVTTINGENDVTIRTGERRNEHSSFQHLSSSSSFVFSPLKRWFLNYDVIFKEEYAKAESVFCPMRVILVVLKNQLSTNH